LKITGVTDKVFMPQKL